MRFLNWLKRLKQSRGHGVHSPFAYELITKVFRSPNSFYAFFDIPVRLRAHGVDSKAVTPFNHLSYRLVHHFKACNILEINPRTGINTLFLMAPSTDINCTWGGGSASGDTFPSIIPVLPRRPHLVSLAALEDSWIDRGMFDAIFVNCFDTDIISVDLLLKLGCECAFWVIHPINKEPGKQYWKQIVNDKRISVTFDAKEMGLVFPCRSLPPSRYFVRLSR